jgi:Divergent 4Fe-4S mono-cluster
LPAVFRAESGPFVDSEGASAAEIVQVVGGCPSGALAYARGTDTEPVDPDEPPSITATVDGPYPVRGSIPVFGADGRAYEPRAPGAVPVRALAQQAVL